MDDPKFILKSSGIAGILAAVAGLLVHYFGLPIEDQEIARMIALVLELGGLSVGIYGRVKAKGPLYVTKPAAPASAAAQDPGFIRADVLTWVLAACISVFLCVLILSTHGCALKQLSRPNQALAVGEELANAYDALESEYLSLAKDARLSAELREKLASHAAPLLDQARYAVVAYRDAAALFARAAAAAEALGQANATGVVGWAELLAREQTVRDLLMSAWSTMTTYTGGK